MVQVERTTVTVTASALRSARSPRRDGPILHLDTEPAVHLPSYPLYVAVYLYADIIVQRQDPPCKVVRPIQRILSPLPKSQFFPCLSPSPPPPTQPTPFFLV